MRSKMLLGQLVLVVLLVMSGERVQAGAFALREHSAAGEALSFAGTAAQIMFDQLKDADKQVYYKAAREGSSAKVSVGNPDPLGILK